MTAATDPLPPWVTAAARLPLAFAQVREDALLDLEVAAALGPAARILMVASGGCTAAALAASGQVARLHLVDPHPAQLALARLKLRLLQIAPSERRLALLGYGALPLAERAAHLGAELAALDLPADALGPLDTVAECGPDHCGRYERVFAELRRLLRPRRPDFERLLCCPAAQAIDAAMGAALDAALDEALALPNLVALFSERATRNPRLSFARHFAERCRWAFASLPAADNPYLWQMLAGRFPDGTVYPWLAAPLTPRLPSLGWSVADMQTALATVDGPFDFVHLSNILDWITPEEAGRLLAASARVLRPGGVVLIRQLNSTLAIPALGPAFEWQDTEARRLHARDRSFFYRALHLGRKR